jgi:hypothetical protein
MRVIDCSSVYLVVQLAWKQGGYIVQQGRQG